MAAFLAVFWYGLSGGISRSRGRKFASLKNPGLREIYSHIYASSETFCLFVRDIAFGVS